MKKIIKKTAKMVINILSVLLGVRYFRMSRLVLNAIYTGAYKRKFKRFGEKSSLDIDSMILNPELIEIGDNFTAFKGFRMEAISAYKSQTFKPEIIIGNNVAFNCDCHIGCINRIEIGNNVLIASRVFITDHSHGNLSKEELEIPPLMRPLVSKGPVIIGDNVWIGDGVTIMPGVRIGKNAVIGANAVVTKDVPDNCIAGGVPAKIIRAIS